jgi:hypothetical protein
MATTYATPRDPQVGALVLTRDRTELGSVAEVAEGAFRVDVPRARDYWLANEVIATTREGFVELSFDAEAVKDFQLSEPGEVRSESPILDDQLDALGDGFDRGGAPNVSDLHVEVDEEKPAYLRPGSNGGGSGAPA